MRPTRPMADIWAGRGTDWDGRDAGARRGRCAGRGGARAGDVDEAQVGRRTRRPSSTLPVSISQRGDSGAKRRQKMVTRM